MVSDYPSAGGWKVTVADVREALGSDDIRRSLGLVVSIWGFLITAVGAANLYVLLRILSILGGSQFLVFPIGG